MFRSIKFSLNSANTNKLNELDKLWLEYQRIVNLFVLDLINNIELTESYIRIIDSSLGNNLRQCAKRQAYKIFKTWCRNKKRGNIPILKNGMTLDQRFVTIKQSKNFFDYWVSISTLNKGERIKIPIHSYRYANKYFDKWNLRKGGKLIKTTKGWELILCFYKQSPTIKNIGKNLGIDIGIKKLMVDSDGNKYGENFESLMNKIQRKQQGSKAFKRALIERDCYINKTAKELPFEDTKIIIVERIKNIKKNTKKEKRLNKEFRSKFQRWTYPKLIGRIQQLAEVGGVHCQLIDPAYTSQTCNVCGFVHKSNRNGDLFKCRNCGYTMDADWNASLNILNRGLAQEITVPEST